MVTSKEIVSIVFIGHVDAGKSTIGGQLLNKLGLIDKRTLEKYQAQAIEKNRESWYLSYALDTEEGERERGKTTEVGRAYFELNTKRVVLLDAPGHAMYVGDMISGANQADIAVLVISARINEFEAGFEKNGQTREHVYLSRAGGIKKMVVLINKMDEVNWNEQRYAAIKGKLDPFLSKIYQDQVLYIPISGYRGDNLLEKSENLNWYKGKTFVEFLEETHITREKTDFAFTIIDKIKFMGAMIYEGKVERGTLTKKDIKVLPRFLDSTILGIYDEEDCEMESAEGGDFVRIKLKENFEQIEEGDVLIEPNTTNYLVSNEFTCVLNILDTHNIISVGYQCVLHLRMSRRECKIVDMASMVNNKLVKKRFAKKGEKIFARIKTSQPFVFCDGDRFALRSENLTISLGMVKRASQKE